MDELIKYKDLCRICLTEREILIDILDKTNFDDKQYLDLMTECSSYNINLHETLPDKICSKCAEILDEYYEFRLRIIGTEKKLIRLLQDDKNCIELKEEENEDQKEFAQFLYHSDEDDSDNPPEQTEKLAPTTEEQPPISTLVEVKPDVSDTNEFQCGTCNKDVQGLKNFLAHLKAHDSKCQVCLLKFDSQEELNEHTKTHPAEGPKFICKYCQRPFKQRRYMVLHYRTHTGERPHLCTFCGKSFTYSVNLVVHQRIHTGIKPYKCKICEAQFTQRSSLVTHQAVHFEHDSQQEFSCKFCGKCFNRKYKIRKHELTHSTERKFPCSYCDKRFKEKQQRDRHEKEVHIDGIKFYCELCDKGFSRTRNLKMHLRTHSGQKPYICQICDKGFAQKHVLLTHIEKHNLNANSD